MPFKAIAAVTRSTDEFEQIYNPAVFTDDLELKKDSLHTRNLQTRESIIQVGKTAETLLDVAMPVQSMLRSAARSENPLVHQHQQTTQVASSAVNFVSSTVTEYRDGLKLSETKPYEGSMQASNAVFKGFMIAQAINPANLLRVTNAASRTMTAGFDMFKGTASTATNTAKIATTAAVGYTERATSLTVSSKSKHCVATSSQERTIGSRCVICTRLSRCGKSLGYQSKNKGSKITNRRKNKIYTPQKL